ncbi:MAG: glycosyltransferase family 2 protein [Saprospiraceae bacterium]|nr:glycosyltransferase family 2 protein [Saprospiraceae bacterium]
MLSIIIPVYNEFGNLQTLYGRLNSTLPEQVEFIFVNDGSTDDSLNLIKSLARDDDRVRYINFSRNFGHQLAVMAGLDHCNGEAAVIIDADLQDPPEIISEMIEKWRSGYEVVYAQRVKRKGETWWKRWTAKWFYRILKRLTDIDIPLDTGDFRLIDRKIIDLLKEMPEKHKFLRGQIAWLGFNQTKITYERDERGWGEPGYSFAKSFRLAIDGITSFSALPLKLLTLFGFICAIVAFLVMVYALYSKYAWEDTVPGWASLMTSVLFLGGVQMIGLGIVGEYLSRVHDNVRRRPDYVIREKNFD